MRTAGLTALALICFAANSLLCRTALGRDLIDAASFTTFRAGSGALTLALIVLLSRNAARDRINGYTIDLRMVLGLFAYMAGFSFAYQTLNTGTGALILFSVVQLTMFAMALRAGESFSRLAWGGFAMAVVGLAWQVSPGVSAPDPLGAVLMAIAGVGWAAYTLLGRGSRWPLVTTAVNFACVLPLSIAVSFLARSQMSLSPTGVVFAIVSGALTSGVGYAIWYAVLPRLAATRAATVQLAVPALAAMAGVLVLAEPVSFRLLGASLLTLGGIAIVVHDGARSARTGNS